MTESETAIFNAIGQLEAKIIARLDNLENRIDSRFNSIDSRFNNLDSRISNIESRLSGIENTVRRIERCLPIPIDNLDIVDSLPPRQAAKRKQQTA